MPRYYITTLQNVQCIGHGPSRTKFSMAQRMMCAALSAYAINNEKTFYPLCEYWKPIQPVGPVHLIAADKTEHNPAVDAAFVTQTEDNWVVLSIRGTEPPASIDWSIDKFIRFLKDWYQDSKTHFTPFHVGGNLFGHVHKGFHDAYGAMLHKIHLALSSYDWSQMKGLQVTGHSKGASLTFLYAVWAKIVLGIKNVEVNGFAPTAIGDHAFAHNYAGLNIPTYRHMRYSDCVPFLLPFNALHKTDPADYDFYHYMHNDFISNPTEAAFYEAQGLITTGYTVVGEPIYYPGQDASTSIAVPHDKGQTDAYWDLITAIKAQRYKIIFSGLEYILSHHSAAKSYYPAVMNNSSTP